MEFKQVIYMDERLGDTMEEMPEIETIRLAEEGLGFGAGAISAEAVESEPGNDDLPNKVDAAINSPAILTKVDTDPETGEQLQDDGCGDGRGVNEREGAITRGETVLSRSLNRSKVFGGGATMAAAARIGLGNGSNSLQTTFRDAMGQMNERGLDYGAHTDNHAHGPNCGCGAIDKSPLIIEAASEYWNDIKNTIGVLGVDTEKLDEVLGEFDSFGDRIAEQPYSGREVMDEITSEEKVVKELADDHLETRIVLNTVRDHTVDQEYIRETTGGRAQVFAVDVWRLQDLANNLYPDEAGAPGNYEAREKAFLSMLVYTLATAGVLTKGDLPVDLVREREEQPSQENVS